MTTTATRGGIKYLDADKRTDPDVVESNEPLRVKSPDVLTSLLNQTLGDAGLAITNQQFVIHVPGCRDQDITFDRCYPKVRVLAHYFSERRLAGQTQDDAMLADIARLKTYAEENKYTFLPVINGEVSRDDLKRVEVEVKGRAVAK